MIYRMLLVAAFAVTTVMPSLSAVAADDSIKSTDAKHDGRLVSIVDGKLTMTDKANKEHSHMLTENAKFTLDDKACKAEDLKAGMKIRVTTVGTDKSKVNRVEAIDKHVSFAMHHHEGKVVSVKGNQLVMTGLEGNEEHTCTLTDDAKITCDGKVCKVADLKKGIKIRVTTQTDEPHSAVKVEAIEKNPEFTSN